MPVAILLFTYSVTLKYPLYFGWSDILLHLNFAQVTVDIHRITPANLSPNYNQSPLFHVLAACLSLITGENVKTAYFVGLPIPFAISSVLVYLISREFLQYHRLARVSMVVYATLPLTLFYSQYMVTRVYGYLGFLFLVYLIARSRWDVEETLLCVLTIGFLVGVHSVTGILIVALLFAMLIINKVIITGGREDINKNIKKVLKLLTIGLVSHMVFLGESGFFRSIVDRIIVSYYAQLNPAGPPATGSEIQPSLIVEISRTININTILILGFVGAVLLLVRRRSTDSLSISVPAFGLVCLFSVFIYIPNPLQSVYILNKIFRITRLKVLVAPFVAISVSYALLLLFENIRARSGQVRVAPAVIVVIVLLLTASAGLSPVNSSDISNINTGSQKMYFNQGEMSSFDFVEKFVPEESKITTDTYVWKYLPREFSQSGQTNDKRYETFVQNDIDDLSINQGYLLLRIGQYERTGMYFGVARNKFRYSSTKAHSRIIQAETLQNSNVYDNGEVKINSESNNS
ncbi:MULTISPECIES: hypothetical protein [unclassified Haloferax]|uniref:hypothetical protein n=1 Tax=unclassified Haloferax TaxID=2625095 RepID=UPI0011C05A5B|nr:MULTISPECIES: hypothetical protein [unclassified Haloferax]